MLWWELSCRVCDRIGRRKGEKVIIERKRSDKRVSSRIDSLNSDPRRKHKETPLWADLRPLQFYGLNKPKTEPTKQHSKIVVTDLIPPHDRKAHIPEAKRSKRRKSEPENCLLCQGVAICLTKFANAIDSGCRNSLYSSTEIARRIPNDCLKRSSLSAVWILSSWFFTVENK
jgi:hypothetical protein